MRMFAFLATAFLLGPACLQAAPPPSEGLQLAAPEPAPSWYKELETLHRTGKLPLKEFLQFRLTALFHPERIPAKYAVLNGARPDPIQCPTGLLVDTYKLMQRLSEPDRTTLADEFDRPSNQREYVQSELYPFRVHYWDVPTERSARDIKNWLEETWTAEVRDFGFRAPLPDLGVDGSDDLDVYQMAGNYGGFVSPEKAYPATPYSDVTVYMVINHTIPYDSIPGVIAHEFHHTSQMATDANEDANFIEQSATFVDGFMFPNSEDNYWFIPAFQSRPFLALNYFDWGQPYQYGSFLFSTFLMERFGGDTIFLQRDIWEGCPQVGFSNEPDYLDSLAALLPGRGGTTVDEAFTEFSVWRYFLGSNRVYTSFFAAAEAWGSFAQPGVERRFDASEYPVQSWKPTRPPYEYGVNFLEFNCGDERQEFQAIFEGDSNVRWAVQVLYIRKGSGSPIIEPLALGKDGRGFIDVPDWSRYRHIVFVVANLGRGEGFDPDQWENDQGLYTISALVGEQGTLDPNPLNKAPEVWFGGYSGNLFQVYAGDPDGDEAVARAGLYYQGQDTGVSLTPLGGNFFGMYLPAGIVSGRYVLEAKAVDTGGKVSGTWPYLTVIER